VVTPANSFDNPKCTPSLKELLFAATTVRPSFPPTQEDTHLPRIDAWDQSLVTTDSVSREEEDQAKGADHQSIPMQDTLPKSTWLPSSMQRSVPLLMTFREATPFKVVLVSHFALMARVAVLLLVD
jgi:hypothetical protein